MPKPEKQSTPIPDTNRNGTLDGQDILRQLAKEYKNDGNLKPAHPAHGIFETLGLPNAMRVLNGSDVTVEALQGIADSLNIVTQANATNASNKLAKDPDAGKNDIPNIIADGKESGLSAKAIDAQITNYRSYVEFAKSFGTTFPHGVRVEAQDIPAILSHFGTLVIPVPPEPSERPLPIPGQNIAATPPKGRFI